MKPKVVIFDLDGTLIDSLADLSAAVNFALAVRSLPGHTLPEYRTMVGHGVRNLVQAALPAAMRDDGLFVDEVLADFRQYYTDHIDVLTYAYPGMQALLERLHEAGVRLAVASNKFQEGTERLVARFFPGIPFVAILGNRPGCPLKPDPEIVGEVLRVCSVSPEDAVMVGDSGTDMATAANGGIRAIAVSWGYRTLPPSDAYRLVHSADELSRTLLS